MPKNKWKPQDGDSIILILGQTGSGKSTFINAAFASGVATVGHTLNSCTTVVKPHSTRHPRDNGQRVVLVDTPGFNDTRMISDSVIIGSIADWLKYECGLRTPVAGVIVLHEISQNVQPYDVTDEICHSRASSNILLALSKWNDTATCIHHKAVLSSRYPRVTQLRFMGTYDSAWTIIDKLRAEPPIEANAIRECLLTIRNTAENSETTNEPGFFTNIRKKLFGNT